MLSCSNPAASQHPVAFGDGRTAERNNPFDSADYFGVFQLAKIAAEIRYTDSCHTTYHLPTVTLGSGATPIEYDSSVLEQANC